MGKLMTSYGMASMEEVNRLDGTVRTPSCTISQPYRPAKLFRVAEDEDGSIDAKPFPQQSKQVNSSKYVNMGRELQKKKNRSSINKIKNKVKTKSAKKRVNPLGNAIIAANW